jgi:hypothetical protein
MPIKLNNLDNGLGIEFLGEGVVTGQDIILANKKVLSSKEKIERSKYCIINFAKATDVDIATPEVDTIAAQDREIAKHRPDYIVGVVAQGDLEFGVSRMWEVIAQTKGIQWETMVFKDRKDVEQWIKNIVKEKDNIDLTMV